MKQYREILPFVSDERADVIGRKFLKIDESFKLFPITSGANQYIVIAFYKGHLLPPRVNIERFSGFMVLDNNYKIVIDHSQFSDIIKVFSMWTIAYFRSPVKRVPKVIYSFYQKYRSEYLLSFYAICKNRYEQNLYKISEDPLEKHWNAVLQKLDLNVINYYKTVLRFDAAKEKVRESEKKLCEKLSFENAKGFFEGVKELNAEINSYDKFLKERSEIMYEADKIMYEKLSGYSFFYKLFSGAISWILKTPLAILILPLLPKFINGIYQETMGYRRLLRSLTGIRRLKIRLEEIIKNWEIQIPPLLIRTSTQ